jgi:hypothetical protein
VTALHGSFRLRVNLGFGSCLVVIHGGGHDGDIAGTLGELPHHGEDERNGAVATASDELDQVETPVLLEVQPDFFAMSVKLNREG